MNENKIENNQEFEQMYQRLLGEVSDLRQGNRRRIRKGLWALVGVTVGLLALVFISQSSKVIFLLLWIVSMFGVAAYLFRDLLQIGTLTLRSLPLFLILAAASLVLYSLVAWAIGRAAAAVRARKAGRQRNAPDSRRRGHGA